MHNFDYYLKLPFEVFYASIPVSEFELIGVRGGSGIFQSLALKRSYGTFYSQTLSCETNTGQELLCCLLGQHDEVNPPWLEHVSAGASDSGEEEWGLVTFYSGSIKDETIKFKIVEKSKQKTFANLPSLDLDTLLLYELSVGTAIDPQYYVLDAKRSRLKVNPKGEVLSENGTLIGASLFDPDELWDVLPDIAPESLDIWEAKNKWIQRVIHPYFPDGAHVELAADSD